MFSRVDDLFIVTVNNLKALEAVSEWVYFMWKSRYVIQIELFPKMTLYRICIPMAKSFDEKVKRQITKFMELRNIQLIEEIEA